MLGSGRLLILEKSGQDLEKTSRHASSSLWTLFCKFGMYMVVPNMEISSFSSTHACMDVQCLCLQMKWLFNVCSLNRRTIFLFKNDRLVFCIYLIYMYLVVSNISLSIQLTARTWTSLEDIFWGPTNFRGELLVSGSVNILFRRYIPGK